MTWRQIARSVGGIAMLMASAGFVRSDIAAQDIALASRGPRFLAPVLNAAPVVIDVRTMPLLRRQIKINFNGTPVRDALTEITRQTGLTFVYMRDVINPDARVDLQAKRISVAGAISEVLLDAGVDVLFVSQRQAALIRRSDAVSLGTPPGAIAGRVTDAKTGSGVAHAEVVLDGTRWRVATDTTGRYRLSDVTPGEYTLRVRRVGYTKQSRKVTARDGQEDTVDIALAPMAVPLDELVTTATGRQRRRDIANAVTTIRADSVIRNAPIRNLTDLLENRVPGLTVQHTSGAPGDPSRVRLRGISSVLRSNDPVVMVDGVRVYAVQSGARSGNLTNLDPGTHRNSDGTIARASAANVPAPSPLDQIDPNIIETIDVLNGPSAATLYGADAANGVIVITTKRGKAGPTRWEAIIEGGRTDSPGRYPTGYFGWGSDLLTGAARFCSVIDQRCVRDSLVQFQALNDPAVTVLGHGVRTGATLAASGGNQTVTYRITGSYSDETGLLRMPAFEVDRFRERFNRQPPDWMQHPHHLKQWTVTSAMNFRLGSTADVSLSSSLGRTEQQRTTLEAQVASLAGSYVDKVNGLYYLPSRSFSSVSEGDFTGYFLGASADILRSYYTRQTASSLQSRTGANATWRPTLWFNAVMNAGIDLNPRDDRLLLPAGLSYDTDSGSIVRGTGRSLLSMFSLQGTATKRLGRGFNFMTSVGANLETQSTNEVVSSASGLVPRTQVMTGATRFSALENAGNSSIFGWYIEPRIVGERLSLSTGLRLDGGSSYGVRFTRTGGGLLGLLALPKLGGSWVISDEPWFPFAALFSSLRLRGAYGQAQVQPGVADRLRLYAPPVGNVQSVDRDSSQLVLSKLGNSVLRPERATELEGGFTADIFDSRVSVEFTGYRKLQVDAILATRLPGSVHGGGTILSNIGNIRNTGVELALNVTPVRQQSLIWTASLLYSKNSNTLVKLGNGVPADKAQGFVEGYPVGGRWARPIIGYADQNGDGALQPQEIQVGDSLVFMGRLLPDYTSSFSTAVSLFGGSVSISGGFSYEAGAMQVDQTARTNWVLVRALVDPGAPRDQQAAVLASTQLVNPTDYGLMQTVSTFRFNSLSLNYRLPMSAARRLGAQGVTLALQGSNLGLHSNYRGKDPDVSSWNAGENIVDTGQLPQPRTWQFKLFVEY